MQERTDLDFGPSPRLEFKTHWEGMVAAHWMAKKGAALPGQTLSLAAGQAASSPLEHKWGYNWLPGTWACKGSGGAGMAEGLGHAGSVSGEPQAGDHEARSGLWRCQRPTHSGHLVGEEHHWISHSQLGTPYTARKRSPFLLQCSSSTLRENR